MRELAELLSDRLDSLLPALGLTSPTQRTRREWRFGNRGSLSIEVGGQKRGQWFDHEAEEGGGPLELIARQLDYGDKREAADWARRWLGLANGEVPAAPKRDHQAEQTAERREKARKASKARKIVDSAQGADRTPGAEYLRNRGITASLPACVRYTVAPEWIEGDATGALVVSATTDHGTVQAAQRIYIRDGRKATVPDLPNGKRSNGHMEGAAARMPGPSDKPLVLAEGPETALSIWQASSLETWAALGSIAKLKPPHGRVLIVARDGDKPNSPADKTLKKALDRLNGAGHEIRVAKPPEGLDWNDVLQRDGGQAVAAGIENAQPYPPEHSPHWDGPSEDRDSALARQQQAITGFFDRARTFVAANDAFTQRRSARLQAEGLDEDPDWIGEDEKRQRTARKAAITRAVKAEIRAEYGIEELDAGDRLLVTGAQGTGKTATTLGELAKLPPDVDAWLLQPTLAKAEEVAEEYAAKAGPQSPPMIVVRGRSAADPDQPRERMCHRHETAERVAAAGFDVQRSLCEDKRGRRCPFFDECGYQAQKKRISEANGAIYAMAHDYAFMPSPAPSPGVVVSDETILPRSYSETSFHPERISENGNWQRAGNNGLDRAMQYVTTAQAVRNAVTAHQGREMAALREAGIDLDALKDAEQYLRDVTYKDLGDLDPTMDDAEINTRLDQIEGSDIHKVALLFRAVRREWETGRDSLTAVMYRPNAPVTVDGKVERQARVTVHYLRRNVIGDRPPCLVLDGTGDVELNRKVWGERLHEERIAVERDANVVQVRGKSFSRQSITGMSGRAQRRGEDRPISEKKAVEADQLRQQITQFLNGLDGRVFAAATKQVEETVLAPLPIETGHFSALRGMNAFETCDTAVVVGREQVAPQTLEAMTRAFAADDAEPLTTITPDGGGRCLYPKQCRARRMRDGSVEWDEVEVHPDPRCQRMLEQIREAEIVQAIDRVRPVFNRRTIYVLTSVVLDLTVDRTTTWQELREGGNRFERLMQRTGFVPLSPKLLHRVAPDLFASEKAAERALERVGVIPPTALIEDTIRSAGGINTATFRRAGQKGPKPSRTLFDPSRFADPEDALAKLIGEDLVMWEIEDPDPVPPVPVQARVRPASTSNDPPQHEQSPPNTSGDFPARWRRVSRYVLNRPRPEVVCPIPSAKMAAALATSALMPALWPG